MMITKNPDNTFSVSNGTEVVFTGSITEAMQVHARLSLAAKGPAKVTPRKVARLQQIAEAKQAGR